MSNPILDDRTIDFLLYEVFDIPRLCELPFFADHSRETFDLFLGSVRRLSRDHFLPSYASMDEAGAQLEDGRVRVDPVMKELWPKLTELGLLAAARPYDVGGQQLPFTMLNTAVAYLYGGNLGASGFAGLTLSAAHLIEAFGDDELRETFMKRMYAGEWTGTMALTEPQAGSSLADVRTSATPAGDGRYRLRGSKIFISGGDQDFTENVVNLVLARIDGAPAGVKGISLFAVPRLRPEGDALVDNDVSTAGLVHKLGWRGLPSTIQSYGERGDCHGWLVGEPHQGLRYMFQMMNEARVGVGVSAAATASAGYLEALAYAKERAQGRSLGAGPDSAPVAIIQHDDVRRMLLRQKAIVEGALALCVATSRYVDLSEHAEADHEREHARELADLLTPITKSFPAERGFESNALAVQVHGGYGYSTEYLPQAWLRDQKLNSLHEGTTGIQSLDLLGRKVMKSGGASLMRLADEIGGDVVRAKRAGVPDARLAAMQSALERIAGTTAALGERAASDMPAMLRHSAAYLELVSTAVIGWQWIKLETAALERADGAGESDASFYEGKRRAAQFWFAEEMPRIDTLAALIDSADDSFSSMPPDAF
jgi:butyryl-CoA dehydrogenase